MAGGMGWKPRPTLAERAAAARESTQPIHGGAARPRHCWVREPPGHPGTWPGLLVERRRTDSGTWRGRVVFVVGRPDDAVLIDAWISFEHLTPL